MGSGSDPGGAHHHHQQRPWYSLFRHMPLEVSVAWRQGEGVIYTTKDEERERLEAGAGGRQRDVGRVPLTVMLVSSKVLTGDNAE